MAEQVRPHGTLAIGPEELARMREVAKHRLRLADFPKHPLDTTVEAKRRAMGHCMIAYPVPPVARLRGNATGGGIVKLLCDDEKRRFDAAPLKKLQDVF